MQRLIPTFLTLAAATGFAPLAAPAMWVLLGYFPGRIVLGWVSREAPPVAGRRILSVAISLVASPLLLYPLWSVTSDRFYFIMGFWAVTQPAWTLYLRRAGARSAGARAPSSTEPVGNPFPRTATRSASPNADHLCTRRTTRVLAAAIAAVVCVAAIGPYWPAQLGGQIVPSSIHDFIKHHAVLFSLERSHLPLSSPFQAAADPGPAYYYHFFYLVPATVRAVCSHVIGIKLAFGVQAALVALAVVGMVFLLVRRATGSERSAILSAALVSVVGGLDVIGMLATGKRVITIDAWADHTVRIHNLLNQMMWSPQNVQGVLVALVAAWCLSVRVEPKRWIILGPALFVALIGSSVWVAVPVTAAAVMYVVHGMVRAFANRAREEVAEGGRSVVGDSVAGRDSPLGGFEKGFSHQHDQSRARKEAVRTLGGVMLAAVLAAAAAAPLLSGYLDMSRRLGSSLTFSWPHQSNAVLGRLVPAGVIANLLDLPWVLVLECGALIVLPLLAPRRVLRQMASDPGVRFLLVGALAAIGGFVVVRSHFDYNDFGQKSMMVALVAGAIMGGAFAAGGNGGGERRKSALRMVVAAVVIALGLAVSLWEVPLTVTRRFVDSAGPLRAISPPDTERYIAESAAYRFVRDELPPDAIVQGYWGDERLTLLQCTQRRLGAMILERDTKVLAPRNLEGHQRVLAKLETVLAGDVSAEACHQTLKELGITHLFVGSVERQAWTQLERFDDDRFFEAVYHDAAVTIYTVR